ncbi:unnamed protein product [Acanthoscelides obtectus]|uniref:Uncharacterized protein n=1 Tax=Acanthoscelides obtectus TaxID=200917 RepID=A0A9P0MCE4_ACAOB|nr:unnamed protein product [Acanthoscelides obtectus]CAK1671132.1 hypothetical protein AOBTE_LOCUS28076 [Acanthoscelides obtectus]
MMVSSQLFCRDLLKKSNSARILFTSSPASYFHDLRGFDKKQLTTGASIHNYSSTKCLSIVCSDIFADKLKKYNITSNAWHPIGATTPIFQRCLNETKGGGNIALVYLLWFGARILTPEPRRAVLRAVYLACAKEMEGVTKGFFMPSGAARRPAIALNENFCQEVWDLSEEAVQLKREEKL